MNLTQRQISSWLLYCIVCIHFYCTSHSLSLSEALPTTAIGTVSEFTRYKQLQVKDLPKVPMWRLEMGLDPAVERHRLYQSATTPHNTEYTHYTFLLTIIKLSGARDIFQILVILQLPGKNANSNSLQVLTLSGDITILLASPNRLLISSKCTIKNCRRSKHLFIIIWSKLL